MWFCTEVPCVGLATFFMPMMKYGQYNDFLSARYNYLMTVNVDWFSPFDHGHYSVEVYLTIQNLPGLLASFHTNNVSQIMLRFLESESCQ